MEPWLEEMHARTKPRWLVDDRCQLTLSPAINAQAVIRQLKPDGEGTKDIVTSERCAVQPETNPQPPPENEMRAWSSCQLKTGLMQTLLELNANHQ
ncbi:hypothetical protein [Xanthomonas arboricola]|uniref:hypothetical protein n=1 Tax=Xanthomonas arboricola TaxID=56448 RepID=UPI003EBFE865